MGENPVDVTQAMNPFKVSLLNDNNEPAQQIQRGDPYFFNVETSGKFPGKSSIQNDSAIQIFYGFIFDWSRPYLTMPSMWIHWVFIFYFF